MSVRQAPKWRSWMGNGMDMCVWKSACTYSQAYIIQDFPGGPVVKNPPSNAGDLCSIPDLRRFHMPSGN